MSAEIDALDHLSTQLLKQGVGGFCPTTLSASPNDLLKSVTRLGRWISRKHHAGAKPLGIHLEGPFLAPTACGAHPPHSIRPFDLTELERLWKASQQNLKIITLAPETLPRSQFQKLISWARTRGILLSLGHSHATELEAQEAFEAGFRGVTHAWNALSTHHREPGVLGAALGRSDLYLELIIDQIHVSPTFIRWTLALHPPQKICFISDAAPAAGTKGGWISFGNLKTRFKEGACRLAGGQLAGGGRLLPESYIRWLLAESSFRGISTAELFQKTIHHLTTTPLQVLGFHLGVLENRRVTWKLLPSGKIRVFPGSSR